MTDISFDSTWCPVCSRQILPKRIRVPVEPPEASVAPAPPPPSPTSQTKNDAPPMRLNRKGGTIRARGGLVHGTGRVRPNGTIKRSPKDSHAAQVKKTVIATSTPAVAAPAAPIRHRTVIDQTPVPLYCSDECRLADLQTTQGLDIRFNPEQHVSPPLPAVPPNSATDISPNSDSDFSGSSLESENSSIPTPISPTASPSSSVDSSQSTSYPIPKAYAALASIYDLPPCPPPPPLLRTDTSSSSGESDKYDNNYECGIIMASRRINEALQTRPKPQKRPSWSTPSAMLSTQLALSNVSASRAPIPGWTDGSDKWRASVYSFASPSRSDDKAGDEDERILRAYTYKGVASTPLRSYGVYSTLGEDNAPTPSASAPAYHPGPQMARARSEAEELYSKFDFAFTKRSESRTSLRQHPSTSPTGSTRSLPVISGSYRTKEVPILKKGAEGKLLVPDVKMKRVDSCSAMSSSGSSYAGGSVYGGGRRRSPLSRQGSTASVASTRAGDTDRSPVEPRLSEQTWSYKDSLYPIMQIPRKEKRIERRVVDGRERAVEVEVEVIPERKRLFLFPGKSSLST